MSDWLTFTLPGSAEKDGEVQLYEALESEPERVRVVGFGPKHDGICEVPRGTIMRFRAKVTERNATAEEKTKWGADRIRDTEWTRLEE